MNTRPKPSADPETTSDDNNGSFDALPPSHAIVVEAWTAKRWEDIASTRTIVCCRTLNWQRVWWAEESFWTRTTAPRRFRASEAHKSNHAWLWS